MNKSTKYKFSGLLAKGLLESMPFAKDPVEAVTMYAEMLVIESGMTKPPFSPESYAPLRRIKEIIYRQMEVDGRLVPFGDSFLIELNKNCSVERRNFTFAHEIAHTFFYESVPKIKYRTSERYFPSHDEEEEKLCNIAAAELLMPRSVFIATAKGFLPSAESLQEISKMFATSLSATVIRLLSLKLWNASFILWKYKDGKISSEWIASPSKGLQHSQNVELVKWGGSSVQKTFITGGMTSNLEWFNVESSYKLSRFQSIRINSNTVLSCLTNQTRKEKEISENRNSLPLGYDCECSGTGWKYIKVDGRACVTRCLSREHKKPQN